jgi:hypothetical protein
MAGFRCNETGERLDSESFGSMSLIIRDPSLNRMAISVAAVYLSPKAINRLDPDNLPESPNGIKKNLFYVIRNTFGSNFGTIEDPGGIYFSSALARKHLPKSVKYLDQSSDEWKEYDALTLTLGPEVTWATDFFRGLKAAQSHSRR